MTTNTASSKHQWLIPLMAIAALLVIIGWVAGMFSDKIEPATNSPDLQLISQSLDVREVETVIIEPVPATLSAKQATIISSRIMAGITDIKVRSGDTVKKGQLLLTLEQSDLQSRVSQAQQQIHAITARTREAQQNLQRVNELHQRGLVANADLDKARANNDSLQAELATAQQAFQEAQTAVGFTQIHSPIDGRVVDRFAEPGDTAIPGEKLLSLYNPLSLRVEAPVRAQLALQLDIGQMLQVEIPTLQTTLDAEVEERVPAADPGSRTFQLKARINFDPQLLPGMYARLLVPAGKQTRLLIPADRVASVGQLNVVWIDRNGQIEKRFIRTGKPQADGQLEVIAGLQAGEKILPIQQSKE